MKKENNNEVGDVLPGDGEKVLGLDKIRKSKGLTLREISSDTRINFAVLEAIEKEEFESLPEPIYTKAFIKTYAQSIGMDGESILALYNRYLDRKSSTLIGEEAQDQVSWVKKNVFFLVIVLAVLFIFSLFFIFSRQDSVNGIKPSPGNSEIEKSSVSDPGKNEQKEEPQDTALSMTEEKEPSAAVEEEVRPQEPAELEQQAATPEPEPALEEPEPEIAETGAGIETPEPETAVAEPEETHTLVIKATETTWVMIQEEGASDSEMLLQPGDRIERKLSGKVKVIVGNASGVEMEYDGKSLDTLGEHGVVRHIYLPKQ